MVSLKQTLAPLLVIAVGLFQPFCEATGNKCIYKQTNAVKAYIDCVFGKGNQAKCRKVFTRVWRKLTRSKLRNVPICHKEYPPSQSVVSVVNACTQAYFKEQKCRKLAQHFLDLAHNKDKVVCNGDKKKCADGSYVNRDPDNDCNFEPCCCPAEEFQYCFIGIAKCCPNGEWSCPSNGEYMCEGEWTQNGPFGEKCPISNCCDASKEPGKNGNPFCFDGYRCCPDGTWSCSIGDGRTFPCGGVSITSGFGQKCP